MNFICSSIESEIMAIYLIKFEKSSLCILAYNCNYCKNALKSKALENKDFFKKTSLSVFIPRGSKKSSQ